jgi:DNA-binding MarR family transcriptional regulator
VGERLRRELKQTKPFKSAEEEVFLQVERTADALQRNVAEVLRPSGLSGPQYNVLRILRGAGADGLACRDIGERMVTRDPDLTRLLDRLEKRGLIRRARDHRDRRVVVTRITDDGLELLAGIDQPLAKAQRAALGHLGATRLKRLADLLEAAREAEA